VTVLGIDCPPVVGSAAAIQPHARARLSLRVPPGMDPAKAHDALAAHLHAATPWGVRVTVGVEDPICRMHAPNERRRIGFQAAQRR
jgi:acetylornithine deacetylase/succinyl-diaminopimelate desuccinylase-like protein